MITPAQRHFIRARAAKMAGNSQPQARQSGDQHELMQAALWEAKRTLKNIRSVEAKVKKKAELLPQFRPYIDGVLESGVGAQDDVLMTAMVWLFDVGDLPTALQVAAYALKHNLNTPDHYQRNTPTVVAEQTAEEAMKLLSRDDADVVALIDSLQKAEQLTAEHDMHDQVRAKLHKALGYALRRGNNLDAALKHLKRALELNDRVGVKKDIEQIEREIKKQDEGAATADAGTESHADAGRAPSGE